MIYDLEALYENIYNKRINLENVIIERICNINKINRKNLDEDELHLALSPDFHKSIYIEKMDYEDLKNHIYNIGEYNAYIKLEDELKFVLYGRL